MKMKVSVFIWALYGIFTRHVEAAQDVCMADTFKAQCDPGDVVVMETALYGRMETGTCLKEGAENIGCTNDILYLLDQWCSGKRECEFMPLAELAKIKTEWCGGMIDGYLSADYKCLSVVNKRSSECTSNTRVLLSQHEGFLASHVTDETGCGSPNAPWVIEAKSGQKINISLLDFGVGSPDPVQSGDCVYPIGTISEPGVGRNHSICGDTRRKLEIYKSESNLVEIRISRNRNRERRFILHYQTVGCPDLSPPAHAWYTRDGNQATIGCDVTERLWHLECHGNRWEGVVGNCTLPEKGEETEHDDEEDLPLITILTLGAIIATTAFLSLVILCFGFCYTRHFRMRHRNNKDQMTALTIYRKSTEVANSHYRPVSMCSSCHGTLPPRDQPKDQSADPTSPKTDPGYSHIWERPLPDPTHKRAPSSVSGYLAPNNTNNPPGGAVDTQKTSLLEEDNTSGYYCPETGHKYYVLDQKQC